MLVDQLDEKTKNLGTIQISTDRLTVGQGMLDINGEQTHELTKSSQETIEHYIGLSKKFKKSVTPMLKNKVINEVFEAKATPVTLVFDGENLVNIASGLKELIPLDEVFATVDKIVPDGELSLFKTNGFNTEFAVTSPEIAGSPEGKTEDVTRGGVYLNATSAYNKPLLKVIPILHRMSCSNQMSQAQKNSALKVQGTSYDEVLLDLEEIIDGYLNDYVPTQLNRWLGLDTFHPTNPNKFAYYLMGEAKINKKIQKTVIENLGYGVAKPSAYQIINTITEQQHHVTEVQRESLWRLGAQAIDMGEQQLIACKTCQSEL